MTTIDRDRLRKLAAAATPGPWKAKTCEPCAKVGRVDVQVWDERGELPIAQWMDEFAPDATEDAKFIAAAREAIPELLDALDHKEARLQAQKAAHTNQITYWQGETRIAQARSARAEDRIQAVESALDRYTYRDHGIDREAVPTDRVRRALDGD